VATALPGTILERYLLTDRFRPLPHVVWARHTDATVLLDAERGLYYTLNDVAGRAWELLAAGEPVIELQRCLTDEYEVSSETVREDLDRLLDRMLYARLVERISPS
jgi:hypothetical protein